MQPVKKTSAEKNSRRKITDNRKQKEVFLISRYVLEELLLMHERTIPPNITVDIHDMINENKFNEKR